MCEVRRFWKRKIGMLKVECHVVCHKSESMEWKDVGRTKFFYTFVCIAQYVQILNVVEWIYFLFSCGGIVRTLYVCVLYCESLKTKGLKSSCITTCCKKIFTLYIILFIVDVWWRRVHLVLFLCIFCWSWVRACARMHGCKLLQMAKKQKTL